MFCKFELGCKVETMFVSLLNDVLNVFCFQRYLQCRTLTQYKVYPEEHIYSLQFVVGVTLWAFGFWTNLEADDILRNLRKPGDKKQVIWCRRREYCMLVQILHTLRTQVVFYRYTTNVAHLSKLSRGNPGITFPREACLTTYPAQIFSGKSWNGN